jgi:hypothetical protein
MIVIQDGVWRAECIAALDWVETDFCVQVFPLNSADCVDYQYDTKEQAAKAYHQALRKWIEEMDGR